MRRSVAGTFALLIAAIVTAGCGPIQSSQATAPSGTPPSGGSTPAIPSSAAATASPSPSASLPQVPAGLPVMPRAEPVDPDPGVIGRWEVAAIGPDVYQFYLDALPAAGFVVTDRYPGGNVAVIRFATPDGTSLDLALVGVGEDSSRTRIDLLPTEGP